MPEIAITTGGAAILGPCMLATVLVWKFFPTRNRGRDWAADFAVMVNELKHLREDMADLKEEMKSMQSKLS